MSTLLFNREIIVTVGAEDPATQVRMTGFRVTFKADKTPASAPNTLDCSVYNLKASTREAFKKRLALVTVEAGYTDDVILLNGERHLPIVFKGDARTIDHVRKGPDWITRIQCGDAEGAFRYAQTTISRGPGASLIDVATDAANALHAFDGRVDVTGFLSRLQSGKIVGAFQQFQNGYAETGNALGILEKLFPAYRVSIQNNELVALKPGEASTQDLQLISAETGMVESPEHGTPNAAGLPSVLKVKCLLRPKLQVGDRVSVKGQPIGNGRFAIDGVFLIQKLTHSGDTAGPAWWTELECMPPLGV